MSSSVVRLAVIVAIGMFTVGQAFAESCIDEVGADEAQMYVDQCLQVSPATHPPCNADNPCQIMRDEIARSCAILGNDAPDFCADY